MPAPIFNEAAAAAIWAEMRRSFIAPIIRAISANLSTDEIVDGIIDRIMQEQSRVLSWLFDRLEAAAGKLDDLLTWDNVRNDKLRDWLEDNDNIYAALLAGLRWLTQAITDEIDRLTGMSLQQAKIAEVRGLLGAGRATAFFPEPIRRAKLTPQQTGRSTQLPVVREPSKEGQRIAELEDEVSRLQALLAEQKATTAEPYDELPPSTEDDLIDIEAEPADDDDDSETADWAPDDDGALPAPDVVVVLEEEDEEVVELPPSPALPDPTDAPSREAMPVDGLKQRVLQAVEANPARPGSKGPKRQFGARVRGGRRR